MTARSAPVADPSASRASTVLVDERVVVWSGADITSDVPAVAVGR